MAYRSQTQTCNSLCGSFELSALLLRSAACHSATNVLSPSVQRSSFYKPSFPAFSCPVASSNSLSPLSYLTLSIPGFPVAICWPDTCSHMRNSLSRPLGPPPSCSLSLSFTPPLELSACLSPFPSPPSRLPRPLPFALHAAHMLCSQHPPSAPSSQAAVLMKEALLSRTNLLAKDRISELFLTSLQCITYWR